MDEEVKYLKQNDSVIHIPNTTNSISLRQSDGKGEGPYRQQSISPEDNQIPEENLNATYWG